MRARIYCWRISVGKFLGNGSGAGSVFFGVLSSDSVFGFSITVGCMWSMIFFMGAGISKSGFFVRIINVVVAIYSGIADSINIPKTKPANPCNSA